MRLRAELVSNMVQYAFKSDSLEHFLKYNSSLWPAFSSGDCSKQLLTLLREESGKSERAMRQHTSDVNSLGALSDDFSSNAWGAF